MSETTRNRRDPVSPQERAAAMRARLAAMRIQGRCIPCAFGDTGHDPHNPTDPICEVRP